LRLDPDNNEARFYRARAYVKKGDMDKAVTDYKEVIRLDPKPAPVYKKQGPPQESEERAKAVDRLEEAMLKSKPLALTRYTRGVDLQKEGKYDEAIVQYDQAIQVYPRYPEVHYNRGLAYRHKSDLERSIVDYTQAIELDPSFIGAYANRGYAFYKMGDLESALADFDKVLELDPQNVDAQKSQDIIRQMQKKGETP
jgi:tetratricopeptide (TPR) repeat protein